MEAETASVPTAQIRTLCLRADLGAGKGIAAWPGTPNDWPTIYCRVNKLAANLARAKPGDVLELDWD